MSPSSVRVSLVMVLLAAAACGAPTDDSDSAAGAISSKGLHMEQDVPLTPVSLPLKQTYSEPVTKNDVTVTPSFTVSGTLDFKNPTVHVAVDYTATPPHVSRVALSGKTNWTASVRVDVDADVDASWPISPDLRKAFADSTLLGGKPWEVMKVPVAVVPLPSAPALQLRLDLEVAASCELDFDANLHASATMAVGGVATANAFFDEKVSRQVGATSPKGDFHVTSPPKLSFNKGNKAQVTGRCSLQPSLNATVAFDVAPAPPIADVGLKFVVEPYAQFVGTYPSDGKGSFDTTIGVRGTVAPAGDFFGLPLDDSHSLTLFDKKLGQF